MKTSRHRYEIILYWSDEDAAYIAEVPELEWCAADGKTYQEALENVEVIIDAWIDPRPCGAYCGRPARRARLATSAPRPRALQPSRSASVGWTSLAALLPVFARGATYLFEPRSHSLQDGDVGWVPRQVAVLGRILLVVV